MTSINHVGVTVPDLDAAVDWYTTVLELDLVGGPVHCDRATAGAERRLDIFGSRWGSMRLAHLVGANGSGLELFQFLEPGVRDPEMSFDYTLIGAHHVAFTVAELRSVLDRLLASGGIQRSAVHDLRDGELIVYCQDPWGNVIELAEASYKQLSKATTTLT